MEKTIVVYSTPTCGVCNVVKEYLDKIGAKYTVKDVQSNRENRKELLAKGLSAIPVTTLDGVDVIGFDKDALDEMANKLSKLAKEV